MFPDPPTFDGSDTFVPPRTVPTAPNPAVPALASRNPLPAGRSLPKVSTPLPSLSSPPQVPHSTVPPPKRQPSPLGPLAEKPTTQITVDGVPYHLPWPYATAPSAALQAKVAETVRATVEHRNAALWVNAPGVPNNVQPSDVAQYRNIWFDDKSMENRTPAHVLQQLEHLPLNQRKNAIPKGWSPVGQAALLQAAYEASPTLPTTSDWHLS